jgi:TP901 family phage tail tape measure protein
MANKVTFSFIALDRFTGVGRKVNRSVGRMLGGIRRLKLETKQAEAITRRAAGGISAGFGKMAAAAGAFFGLREFFTAGMRFQDALADLSAITGATGKDLQFLSDESMRLAKESKTAQAEVAGAFKLVASAKSELLKNPKALSEVTRQVLLLKNATGMDLAQATDVAVTALNQFNAKADQANRFVNVLAAGSKIGASEVAETGEALRKSGVAANLAKVNFEEANAMIQVLAKNGLKASEAGTGLQGVLLKLENSGLAKIRPSVVGVTKALKNLRDMNLSSSKLTKLFGLESIKAGGVLINNADLVAEWTQALKGTNMAQQQAEIRLRTFSAKLRGLGIVIKGVLIKTFLRLEPTLRKLAGSFEEWASSINDKDITQFVDNLKAMGEALTVIVTMGKMVASVFKGVGTAIGEAAAQLSTFNFSASNATSFRDAFSVGGKLFGIFDNNEAPARAPTGASSRTDVNVNLRAPAGAVESVKSSTRGNVPGMNVGVNMAPAGG